MNSIRKQIKDALVAAITALAGAVPVLPWPGEEALFNQGAVYPAIFVAYAGVDFGADAEIGEIATTYERVHLYAVFVATQTDGSIAGDDAAMEILETIETGIAGTVLAGAGEAQPADGEALQAVHLGRYLYLQPWKVVTLESH